MSQLAARLVQQLHAAGVAVPELELRFHPTRLWRFDLAWPAKMVAVEVEGGIFVRGRHSRGAGMRADMEKYNAAVLLGWKLLRVSDRHISDGSALSWIEGLLR